MSSHLLSTCHHVVSGQLFRVQAGVNLGHFTWLKDFISEERSKVQHLAILPPLECLIFFLNEKGGFEVGTPWVTCFDHGGVTVPLTFNGRLWRARDATCRRQHVELQLT